jgi:hypothetical protein
VETPVFSTFKKVRLVGSNNKSMVAVFFDCENIVLEEFYSSRPWLTNITTKKFDV